MRANRPRKWQVNTTPIKPAIRGKISAHREAKDLVGASRQSVRAGGIQGYIGLTLRPTFVRHVHICADRKRGCCDNTRLPYAVRHKIVVLGPLSRIMGILSLAGSHEAANGE